jgi:hypothetical protein
MAFSKARRLANLMSTASDSVPASKVNTTIADDAITTAKIADDAITTALIADDQITTALIADDQITTALIADDAVTADHLANSINSAITANTAKVTNAITTHTGDVTGAAALTIAVDAVDIPMLSATGTPSSTTFLRGDNSWAVPPGQDTISKVSSAPSVGTEGTMYYNTTTDKMYLSNGSVWVEFDTNSPPTSSGGTVTIAAQGGASTFSYNLGIDFADLENTDAELAYSLQSGTLPAGAVLPTSGNTALTGTATNTTATYNFVIRATDTKGAIATQAYTQVITAVTIATGGTITTSGGYRYHTFTSSGTFAITAAGSTLDALVVAGGGGGGGSLAGGGGAGGAIEHNNQSAAVANHSIVIGAGAQKSASGTYNQAYNGNNTTAFSQTAIGGGRGAGGVHVSPYTYSNTGGGSGGGGFVWDNQKYDHSGGPGTSGQGNAGGGSGGSGGAGGGGKGAVGTDADGTGGDGGVGIDWKSLGTYYAGGGGGSHSSTNKGAGGNGGGGAGNAGGVSANAQGISGSANTGGGGGGGFGYGINGGAGGGAGGSGVVIIRYAY